MISAGYPIRPLVDAVGLQFTDLFLGSWRQAKYASRTALGVEMKDLGDVVTVVTHWWDGKTLMAES